MVIGNPGPIVLLSVNFFTYPTYFEVFFRPTGLASKSACTKAPIFSRKLSSEKFTFPRPTCTIAVLSILKSTRPDFAALTAP